MSTRQLGPILLEGRGKIISSNLGPCSHCSWNWQILVQWKASPSLRSCGCSGGWHTNVVSRWEVASQIRSRTNWTRNQAMVDWWKATIPMKCSASARYCTRHQEHLVDSCRYNQGRCDLAHQHGTGCRNRDRDGRLTFCGNCEIS